MKIIRWSAVIPTLIFLLLVFLIAFFLVDPLAKWALIKGGETTFGAKVDIQSVRVGFRDTSLTIKGMAVANKNEPMKNFFELQDAVFDAMALPLLEKRVIIQMAAIHGIRFGTPRTTSGALFLSPQKPGIVAKAVDRVWSQIETISVDKWGDIKKFHDPKTLINPDALKVTAVAKQAQEKILKTPDQLKGRVQALNLDSRTAALKQRVSALSGGSSDPQAIVKKLQDAKSLQTDLAALKTDIASTQKGLTQDLQSARGLVDEVKKAKEDDLKNLRQTFSFPPLDSGTLARALLGPSVARGLERGLDLFHKAKTYMPAKAQQPPPPPRGHGRTIEFPREHEWPRFLLMKSALTGEVGLEKPFAFQGELNGVTSNPPLYGKPMTLLLHGSEGSRSMDVQGTLDFTQDITRTLLSGSYKGFALPPYTLGQPNAFSIALNGGTGSATGTFKIEGDQLAGDLSGSGTLLTLTPQFASAGDSDLSHRLAGSVTSALASVHTLTAHVSLHGTVESPDLGIESNLGQVIANAFKGVVGDEVARQEAALRAELDRLTNAKIQELSKQVDGYQQQFLGPLSSQNKVVDDLVTQVKTQLTKGSGLSGVQNKAADALKGLFRH
jgi:uncharacterized protein (TIGR03545 family)